MKKLIPETIENKIPSNKFVYYFTWLLVAFNFFRSLEHIFNEDGGAQSIAGIPLDFYVPEASNNIISIFAQWGFSQLVLADSKIDLVVSSILISMGMMMLPPVLVSLPFKLLLFVLVDGWTLLSVGILGQVADPLTSMMGGFG